MLKLNSVYKCKVIKVDKTYALLQAENTKGIVHISEISDYLVKNINDFIQEGKIYEFKLIKIDKFKGKYYFSLKQLNPKLIKKRQQIIETTSGFSNVFKKMVEALDR